ncbi:MAG: flavin reductase family protein [Rhizobium sp.]|nr:flavin reductase family protein [Rhizobium sp.]
MIMLIGLLASDGAPVQLCGTKRQFIAFFLVRSRALSGVFGGKTPVDERFAAAEWRSGITGAPVLSDALVSFDCRISEQCDIGTHRVLYCTVEGIHDGNDAEALIYYRRAYGRIAS